MSNVLSHEKTHTRCIEEHSGGITYFAAYLAMHWGRFGVYSPLHRLTVNDVLLESAMGGDFQACDRLTSAMRRGRCLDNVVVMSYGDGIMPCGEHIKAVIFYVEQHTLWLPNEIMDKEEITFVLLAYYGWR